MIRLNQILWRRKTASVQGTITKNRQSKGKEEEEETKKEEEEEKKKPI